MTDEHTAQQIKQWFIKNSTSVRLAVSYLAIIMAMSLGFSVVFFYTSARQLDKQIPPDNFINRPIIIRGLEQRQIENDVQAFLETQINQGRHELLVRLVWLNVLALAGGSIVSYALARKTLEPIERAMEAQSRFASDASHELRTPLAAIQAENEVALRNPKLTLHRAKELLQSNLEETIRLRTMADSLLRLARKDHQLERKPVVLSDSVRDAINQHIKQAQTKHIAVDDTVSDIRVLGDASGITQIVAILLDNAIKYSPEKTTIHISSAVHDTIAALMVTDEGPGITAQDMPYIFDRFYRADTSRSKQHVEGNGLGLALAASIAAQLQGELSATSTPGKGATFTLKLPVASQDNTKSE